MTRLKPNDIYQAVREAARHDAPNGSEQALLALRDLVVRFLEATDGYPDSMKALSMDQIFFLNKLNLAVGR